MVITQPPSRPEARTRLGSQTASELGAPVASSIPGQLPGREPASARKGYEDALVLRLRNFSIAAIGLEASGGYERGVARALLAAGISVRQVNPFKLRQFARASGVLAKNDPLDARMIASFVGIMPTRPAQRPTPAAEQLAEML